MEIHLCYLGDDSVKEVSMMEYNKPELEAADSIYIFACKHSHCNGQTRVLLEANEVPIIDLNEMGSDAKAS